ncbi:MAG: DUF1080 domain-containing protein [Verrucomicrobiota bacterium]|nr:DUF1080 domain-containing protein [Verrucomicrobiota bacterium]
MESSFFIYIFIRKFQLINICLKQILITKIAAVLLLGCFSSQSLEPLTQNGGEWIYLFNGRDLNGWRENKFKHKPEWKIIDGVLTGHGGQGYLSTFEEFDDFELFAKTRISDTAGGRGNSGIYFRCAPHVDKNQEFPPGYEAQLDHGDNNNPTGSIYALNIEGARAPKPSTKDGEWVTMRIRAVGNHLQTWVNGKPAADCFDPKNRYKKGSILLQMHHLSGKVEFKEVKIRKFVKKNKN